MGHGLSEVQAQTDMACATANVVTEHLFVVFVRGILEPGIDFDARQQGVTRRHVQHLIIVQRHRGAEERVHGIARLPVECRQLESLVTAVPLQAQIRQLLGAPQALAWMIERCIEAGHVDRLDIEGLRDDRRAVIPGGLAILYTLLTHFGIEAMLPAKGALRQGVIVDLHERLAAARGARVHDVRDHTVGALQIRFGIDTAQAARVRAVALALHDAVSLDDEAQSRRELGWVCDLHEIGMSLSHHDYHRHSAYILSNLDAPGFSQSQQRRMGQLVLAQRGGLRKIEAGLQDLSFAWRVLCLRLAVIRCHARDTDRLPELLLSRRGDRTALLSWRPARVPVSPRTLHLLHEEALAWQRAGVLQIDLGD